MTILPDKLIAARTAKGWSQIDLAAKAGISQQAIGKLEKGSARSSKFLVRIARALEVSPGEIDDDFEANGAAPVPLASGYRPPPELLGARDLPVFSAVEGGPGEIVVNTDPIEWVQRPWFLREVKEGYAVVVIGESMVPVYEPGDLVIVNPRLPAIRGKNAIFVGGEERGEFRAMVKRLERSTADRWDVRQWNPPEGAERDFSLPKAEWPKALRIVGKYEGG